LLPNPTETLATQAIRVLNEPHLAKEKPVMGNIESFWGITKACQGNVNGRKSSAAEGLM